MPTPINHHDELDLLMRAARRVPLLDADEERRLALELRRLRRDYCESILEFRPANDLLVGLLASDGSNRDLLAAASSGDVDALLERDPACRAARSVVDAIEASLERHGTETTSWLSQIQEIGDAMDLARTRFAKANLRLVVKTAGRFRQPTRVPFIDLVQEGNSGLLDAIDRYDPGRGVRFSTYAVWWIFHRMTRALADHGRLVRIPSNVQAVFHRLLKQHTQLRDASGREPTVAEAAKRAGVSLRRATRAHRLMTAEVVRPDASEAASRHVESRVASEKRTPNPAAIVDTHLGIHRLEAALEELPQREREIVSRRFGLEGDEPSTFRELAEELGVSGERVRQIQNQGLRRLRQQLGEAPLAA